MQKIDSPPQLHIHEWLAILVILSVLAVLTLITRLTDDGAMPTTRDPPHYVVDQRIEVFVEGAVEKPMRLVVIRGALIEEVLQQVQLLPEADTSKLKLKSKVRRGQHIRVPAKKGRKSSKAALSASPKTP